MSNIKEYLKEDKGMAQFYSSQISELISDFDALIRSMETESVKYIGEKEVKDVKRIISTSERYFELLLNEMNKIIDLFIMGKRL